MSFKVVLQGAVIVLLFAYVALGPYQAYYHQIVDQVRAPVEIAYRAGYNAVSDVWLLATNPTEWYARQQVVNVRPERPIDFPKGIELTSLDALPASVPAGQQFALAAVIKNDGFIDARHVTVAMSCNQWCETFAAKPQPVVAKEVLSSENLQSSFDAGTWTALQTGKEFYIRRELKRGESELITVQPLASRYLTARAGETNFAKINFNLSYVYSTNASLQVSIISENELQRRFREGETVFKPVTAVAKNSPATLSLNVGPQPLKTGTRALLLVSVSNSRDNSKVILRKDIDKIIIRVPKVVTPSAPICGEFAGLEDPENSDVWKVEVPIRPTRGIQNTIEILPREFNSIFAFICNFDTAQNVDVITTGLVTAELPTYVFRIEQKKDVPVTPPLGIIFEPYEAECNKCGDGVLSRCKDTDCHAISQQGADSSRRCYYEYAASTPTQFVSNACHVCGSVQACDKFLTQETCDKEKITCGWACRWRTTADIEASGETVPETSRTYTAGGRCENVEGVPVGVCAEVPSTYTTKYNQYLSQITGAVNSLGLNTALAAIGTQYTDGNALVAGLISLESSWRENAQRFESKVGDSSYGLMQVIPSLHPECSQYGDVRTDTTANIKCGVAFLTRGVNDCRSVEGALRMYNSGRCGGQTFDPNYVGKILGTYNPFAGSYADWTACFQQQQQVQQQTQQAQQSATCQDCVRNSFVWCTVASSTVGECTPTAPCTPLYPNAKTSVSQCPVTDTCSSCAAQGFVWCTTSPGSPTIGECVPIAPCRPEFPNARIGASQCPTQEPSSAPPF